MARARRHTVAVAAGTTIAVLAGLSGCTTTVHGTAMVSQCAKHDLNDCSDWQPTAPPASAAEVATATPQQLCALLDDATLQRIMGGPYYRYLDKGAGCVIAAEADPSAPRFSVALGAFPERMSDYGAVEGNQRTDVAGVPAWINTTDDGRGNREVDYTISTSGRAETGGIVSVNVRAQLPRGVFDAAPPPVPQFDQHRAIAEAVVHAARIRP